MGKVLRNLGIAAISLLTSSISTYAQDYTIDQGGIISACSGTFYDSGGSSGSYANNESHSVILGTGLYGMQVQLDFTSFQLEGCCDYLTIYDGVDASGTQLYYGNGTNSPGTVQSTTGSLYVTFTSDGSVTYSGWSADISCIGTPVANEVSTQSVTLQSCGDARTPITATFFNGGTANIAFPVVSYSINGGQIVSETILDTLFSATGYTYTFQQTADLSASGTYTVEAFTSVLSDPDVSNDTASATLTFQAPAVNVTDTTLCDAGSLSLSASGNLEYLWYAGNDNTMAIDSNATFNPVVVSDTFFSVYESDSVFYIQSLTSTGQVVDHNSLTGDDRGGIAVTDQYVYFNGDNNTARYDAATLANGVSLPRRDGIFSDLSTGDLYTLSNSSNGLPVGTYVTSFTVDEIVVMDTDLNLQNSIALSQPIAMGGDYGNTSQAGIYSGYGYVIVYTGTQGNNWYKIDLPTGNVSFINTFSFTLKQANENWSHWGIATYENGADQIVFREYGTSNISKINLSTQATAVVETFSNLSDMASITYSPWLDRMYFHHESSSQFGSGSEMGGYIGGSSIGGLGPAGGCPAKVYVDLSMSEADLGADTAFCDGNSIVVTPGSFDQYTWSNGANTASITISTSGDYAVVATDEFGCDRLDTITVEVVSNPVVDLGADTILCEGTPLTLDAGDFDSYEWDNGSNDQTRIVMTSGSYTVTVTESICSGEDQLYVTVLANPVVEIGNDTAVGAGYVFNMNAGNGYASYLWSNNDSISSTSIAATSPQVIFVRVVDDYGCIGYDEFRVDILYSTPEYINTEALNLYPNPVKTSTNLQFELKQSSEVEFLLTDIQGRVIERNVESMAAGTYTEQIDMSNVSSGTYILTLMVNQEKAAQLRVVKQ
tara:strand:- start:3468 stop:6128 length:2661 start_codon:yes stop_codon:yes gene_type:complete